MRASTHQLECTQDLQRDGHFQYLLTAIIAAIPVLHRSVQAARTGRS